MKSTKEQEVIATALDQLIDKLGKTDDDKSYVSFLVFSITGAILLRMFGEVNFDELVADIKKATKEIVREEQKN